MHTIKLLDCTLRDGAYIVDGVFGKPSINGIVDKLQNANIDIIECGWLKNNEYKSGTTYYHVPEDFRQYLNHKSTDHVWVMMIDWDRYDLDNLPECDGNTIDAIRVVFPHKKYHEGIKVAGEIKKKGYDVYLQASNTLDYSNNDLIELAKCVNDLKPVALSVVDTFGAMYTDDLIRIINLLDDNLDKDIELGFHSHNNQQLSFSLTIDFIEYLSEKRNIVVDASLCGMGRGAGNATTELVASYLNRKKHKSYDMNYIMDAIDTYMQYFIENYSWGYSTQYFIAGMYCCHVNNISYLMKNHRVNFKEMKNIISSLSDDDRKKYNYDLLEKKYLENQSRHIDDNEQISLLRNEFNGKEILLMAPGKSTIKNKEIIESYIEKNSPILIFVNAINPNYECDYLFLMNKIRYSYAQKTYFEQFKKIKKILLSNVKNKGEENDIMINFDSVIKRGWEHFDNAVITCLRLMDKLHVRKVSIAGFDGFSHKYNESYADEYLPSLNPENKWDELNEEIKEMFIDFISSAKYINEVKFITDSMYDTGKG